MNTVQQAVKEAYKVDVSRGERNSAVSSQWFSRPDDQRFLSLSSLYEHTKNIAGSSMTRIVDAAAIKVDASQSDPDKLTLVDGQGVSYQPTNWGFGQICSLTGAPAGYLRKLPAMLSAINLQYGLANYRGEKVKTYSLENGVNELRAMNSATYGRIFDHEVVSAVRSIAGDGTGDSNWKIPGVLNWETGKYDPFVEITKKSTTLFASDRDVFMFLVDDTHPIEVGKLADGSPDLVFRGFYAWNSEVGSRTFGIACFYLRGVCQNRMLWGVEGFKEINLKHSKNAPARFAYEARPILNQFVNSSTDKLVNGVKAAKQAVVANNDDQREDFLQKEGFTKAETKNIIEAVVTEEGKKPESIWDFVQGITAVAREKGHQDVRVDLEKKAGKLLDKVTRTGR